MDSAAARTDYDIICSSIDIYENVWPNLGPFHTMCSYILKSRKRGLQVVVIIIIIIIIIVGSLGKMMCKLDSKTSSLKPVCVQVAPSSR